MHRSRPLVLSLLLALPLAACDKPRAGDAVPESPGASVHVAIPPPTASPTASATVAAPASAPAPATAAALAPAAPLESAASTAKADEKPAAAMIVLPAAKNGVLAPGVADKLLKMGARPLVRLLAPGDEPRAEIRYALTKGATKAIGLGMDLSMSMKSGGRSVPDTAIPRMVMLLDVVAGDRNADGEWSVDSTLGSIRIEPNGPAQELMAQGMRPQLDALKGLGIRYWMAPQGYVHDVKIALPPGFPPAAEQIVAGMNQSFESMAVPLPADAVGVGAKWQVVSRLSPQGADLIQSSLYTLKARAGARLSLEVTTRQVAASDTIKAPGMPTGAAARVKAFRSSGSGTAEIDTGAAAPEASTMSVKTGMDLGIQGATGTAEDGTVETTTVVTIGKP